MRIYPPSHGNAMAFSDKRKIIATVGVSSLLALALIVVAVTYLPTQPGTGTITSTVTIGPTGSASSTSSTNLGTQVSFSIDPSACNGNCTINPPWQTYETLSDLKGASSLVVVANVTGARTLGPDGVPVTYYNLTVITAIKSNANITQGTQLLLSQIGGTYNGTTMHLEGYPALTVGSEYLFFLGSPGSFLAQYYGAYGTPDISVGGPQGTFLVQGGNVFSLDKVYSQADAWLPVKADGVPLGQFTSEVQQA